jgi:hypothetical protein
MPTELKRRVEMATGHIRGHADYGQLVISRDGDLEIHFSRNYLCSPQEIVFEFSDDGKLVRQSFRPTTCDEVQEILCTIRMRPDHAYQLAIDLLRKLQEQYANQIREESAHGNG